MMAGALVGRPGMKLARVLRADTAEVEQAGEVQLKERADIDKVDIAAKFERVITM